MSRRLKVYILGDYRPGLADGLAEFNYQNAKLLKDTFDINFIEFDDKQEERYFSTARTEDVSIIRFGIKGLSRFALNDKFVKFLRSLEGQFVVFHLNHIYNIRNYLVARRLVEYHLPYIITPHDSYVYGNKFRLKRPFLERTYRDIFVKIFDKYVLDHALVCHALTIECVDNLQRITNSEIKVVHNQISDLNIEQNLSLIKQQACFIGRFDINLKGIDRLISGFLRFQKSNPVYSKTGLVLVGPLPEGFETVQLELFKEFPADLRANVKVTGKVEEKVRNEILAQSKVYVHMSRFEGFGLSIVQALSAYTPVIISKQVPISSIIGGHGAGIVVDSEEELAEALKLVFDMDETTYLSFCKKARLCYELEFHPDIIKPQLLSLYNKADVLH